MKKINLLIILGILTYAFTSVNIKENDIKKTFILLNTDTKHSIEFCEKAISNANWCGFRYENKRNIIQFETGIKVELFSAKEIGQTNPNCYLTDYRNFSNDTWKLSSDGKIIHLVSKQSRKK